MNNILELIQNEKVEWKKLGSIKEIKVISSKHKLQKREYLDDGKYPIIDQGQKLIVGYTNNNQAVFKKGSYVIFGDHTEIVKYVDFQFAQGADGIKVLQSDESYINTRYLYHAILNFYKITGKYMRHFALLKDTEIPIPSLETQEKIVKILDKFTNYVTELQAELQYRTKQYEYYRDMLLSEEYLNKLSDAPELFLGKNNIKVTTLGEIGRFTRGNGLQKKDFIEEGNPVIHYGQIYTKYGFEANQTISYVNDNVFSKLRKASQNDILIATTSENIEDVGKSVIWLGNEEIGFSGDMYSYRTTENAKYIAYYFQTTKFQNQKEKKVTGTKLIRIHGNDMEKFVISLPPIEIQNKVVEVLDKFRILSEDTKGLLPQEIEQRQKQYEYYREKLLTFDIDCGNTHTHTRVISNDYFTVLKEAAIIVGINIYGVELKKLGDVTLKSLEYGSGASATAYNGEVRYIRITDIDEKGNLKREKVSPSIFDEKYLLEYGDILFARSGATVGKTFMFQNDEPAIFAGYLIRLKPNTKLVNAKFVYYSVNTTMYMNFVNETKSRGSQPNINAKQYAEYKITIPSLPVQEYIVSILDKFDALINDISQGLPKEIALRQKQYEHYRNKLLDFK